MKALSIIILFTLFLPACGQKGPLYLPDQQPVTITKEKSNGHSIHKNARTGQ
jgi:predicted small lipoprotein YifL